MTSASLSHSSNTREEPSPTGLQHYHGSLHGTYETHHVEAEPATISIQGLTSGYTRSLDFCVPVTRSHPGDEGQRREALHGDTGRNLTVEHIDISTAWNGLSETDANELFRVHRAFVRTIEKMLVNELWQIYQQFQQQDSAGNISPIHSLFTTGIVRGISFCRDQLVREMAEALYSTEETMAKANLGFLRLYLIATDALVHHQEDGRRDTSITIRMRCDPFSLKSYPVVDAAWVPDSLTFEGLDEHPLEGQTFSIVPRYYSRSAFRPTDFPENVKYSVESELRDSPLSWLVWDNEIAGFKGIVPFYSEFKGYGRQYASAHRGPRQTISKSLQIIVQAVLVDDNGSSIRFERILRVRLAFNVVPWYANDKSRETKEPSSAPKAHRDTRFASAAPRFALQSSQESHLESGQSPSRRSPWSKGAHLYRPNEYAHMSRFGTKDVQPAINSSTTEAALKETELPSLTRIQDNLMAKCVELARELGHLKEQVMMFGQASEHHRRAQHAPDIQEYLNEPYYVPSSRHTEHNGLTTESAVPRTSQCILEHLTAPWSPSIRGKDAPSQVGPKARFSVLPPPAIGLTTCSTMGSQISNDEDTSNAPCTGWDATSMPSSTSQIAAPKEISTAQHTDCTQKSGYPWPLPEKASIASNNRGRVLSSPRQQSLSTPSIVKSDIPNSSSTGKRSRQRISRSSLNESSPLKRLRVTAKLPGREVGAHAPQPGRNTPTLLGSNDEESSSCAGWSSSIFYNSFGPLRSLRSSITLAGEDPPTMRASETETSTNFSESVKHGKQDSGRSMDTGIMDNDDSTSPVSSSPNDGATKTEGVPSKSVSTDRAGQARLRRSSSASCSTQHASTSLTSSSRSTSSDMEFIVEQSPGARKVSRQEQAKLWKSLSQSDSCKEKQTGPEVRLSEDEKKAMNEAIRRSLDDLAKGFEDILLEDSSDSDSDEDL